MPSLASAALLSLLAASSALAHPRNNNHHFHRRYYNGTVPDGGVARPSGTGTGVDSQTTTFYVTSKSVVQRTITNTVSASKSDSTSAPVYGDDDDYVQSTAVAVADVSSTVVTRAPVANSQTKEYQQPTSTSTLAADGTAEGQCTPMTVTETKKEKITITVTASPSKSTSSKSSSRLEEKSADAPTTTTLTRTVVSSTTQTVPPANDASKPATDSSAASTPASMPASSEAAKSTPTTEAPKASPTSEAAKSDTAAAQSSKTDTSVEAESTDTANSKSVKAVSTSSSGKRGVAYNDPALANAFQGSKVAWAYNWDQVPNELNGAPTAGKLDDSLAYFSMLWGNVEVHTSRWFKNADKMVADGVKALLGFNEPDHEGQALIEAGAAATLYKKYLTDKYAGKVRLGSPAVTNKAGPSVGIDWLVQFLDKCSDCKVDFVCIHWYEAANQVDYFKKHVKEAHDKTKLPVWITEFKPSGSDAEVVAFLDEVLPWLDEQDYVEKYSYFMAIDGNLNAGTGLSAVGKAYSTI